VFSGLSLFIGSVEQPSNLTALLVLSGASALVTMLVAVPLVFLINPVLGTPLRTLYRQAIGSLLRKQPNLVASERKSTERDYE
jgi:hypothetical protein